jgi:hypothetical protein
MAPGFAEFTRLRREEQLEYDFSVDGDNADQRAEAD